VLTALLLDHRLMLRLVRILALSIFGVATFHITATAQEPSPTGNAIERASCSVSVAGILSGAALEAATLSRDGTRAVISSDAGVALISTADCTVVAQSPHPIRNVTAVLITDRGHVVVVGTGSAAPGSAGAWSWDPASGTSRMLVSDDVSMPLYVGGEAIILASEGQYPRGVLLRRVDARTGRVTRRHLIPGEPGVYGLGWSARGSVLVLTAGGPFHTSAALSRPVASPLTFRHSGELRHVALTSDGELFDDARWFIPAVSQDGRRAVISSFRTYPPNAAPARWMSWTPGTALPTSMTGPAVPSTFHRVYAVSPNGRALFCEHAHTSGSDEAERARERCWLLDL